MRINGFEQIKSFYSWVFNNPDKVRPTHISLYLFLWNQGNRANWVEWFKCPYDLAMQGACIGNKGTYYRCLDDLQKYNLIKYKKGLNNYKAPQIHLIKLYDNEPLTEQVTVPLSEHLTEPLTALLSGNIYKLITNNYKLINKQLPIWIKDFKNKEKTFNFRKSLIDYGFKENLVLDWLKVRKTKKATNTQTAFNGFISQVEKSNLDINVILEKCIVKSWSGFKNSWLEKEKSSGKKESDTKNKNAGQILKERYGLS